ncbi:hypothetical protein MicB006_0604 [Micromonospora sp. B006]|nr:hypothetical protein MicB006_0604 [Micromonospora sp. B006]
MKSASRNRGRASWSRYSPCPYPRTWRFDCPARPGGGREDIFR